MSQPVTTTSKDQGFVRGLGLFDSVMIVIGVMIGSGIFIVSADMSRLLNSPGWMLMAWVITGVLTITAALSEMIVNRPIADIVPTFDMMNMIGGECDR